jgi:hypothetical protein
MNWLKNFLWCDTWSEFFKTFGISVGLLFFFWAFIWAMYLFFGDL